MSRRIPVPQVAVADLPQRVGKQHPHVHDDKGNAMSDQQDSPSTDTESDAPLDGNGEGIEITTGEPNTFEPEEDPDAATDD